MKKAVIAWIASIIVLVGAANSQCILGTSDVNPTSPHTIGGQYIDIQHPATCRGNITAWHFCYYTDSTNGNEYTLWFRVWRSRGTNRLNLIHEYQQRSEVGGQSQGIVICENVTLQVSEYFEVLPGDVLGVYIPLLTSTVSVIAQNTPGSQLQVDNRQDFDSDRIQRRDLIDLSELGFHLYARIESSLLVPQMTPLLPSIAGENEGPNDGGNGSGSGGTVAAVVVVLLLASLAAATTAVVVLVVYRRRRAKVGGQKPSPFTSIENKVYRSNSGSGPDQIVLQQCHISHDYENTSTITDISCSIHAAPYDIPKPITRSHRPYDIPNPVTQSLVLNSESVSNNRQLSTTEDESTLEESSPYEIVSFDQFSVEYHKLLKEATKETYEDENPYNVPPSREEEIYVVLSKQKIKLVATERIEISGHLGSGQFGSVEKGILKTIRGPVAVAVKTIGPKVSEEDKIKFLQEAAIMGQFKHPNIIQLHGMVAAGQLIMLVLEYVAKGDLKKCLTQIRPGPGELVDTNMPQLLLSYSQQIAFGMHYLASKGFIHRDLAARNILVSKDNICKIADFGMSRDLADENYFVTHGDKIPVKWTAPEAIHCKKYSTASDVWSYGCLLYEIWSLGRKPFKGHSNAEAIQKVDSGYRLSPSPGCPKAIYELMIQCWNPAPSSRPMFRDILEAMLLDETKVLEIPVDDASTNELASILGSPVEAGECMYMALQQEYMLTNENHDKNSDYEVITDELDESLKSGE